MKTPLLLSLLVPTIAAAQVAPDPAPDAPPPPLVGPATPVAPVPVPVAQRPVIIVNPPAQTTTTTYTTEPAYETYVSPWNAPLFTSGALLFLGSYGGAVVVAATTEDDEIDRGNDNLYIPVAGPWLALNDRPDCTGTCDDSYETTKKVLLVADGLLQAGGVVTMIAGMLSPTEYRVARRPSYVSKKVTVSPSAGGNPGITLFGRW